jgi:hypothetical protein
MASVGELAGPASRGLRGVTRGASCAQITWNG